MKAYITKYALSSKIIIADVEVCDPPSMITWKSDGWTQHAHNEGRDWHRDWPSALSRCEAMRTAKIASLKKQIAKLEKLVFTEPV